MAAPGGGRLWSEAWQWFQEDRAVAEVQALKQNIGQLPAVPDPVQEVYQGLPAVSGEVLAVGCTGYIGTAVVFEAVRRGLTVKVFVRPPSVDKVSALLESLKIKDRVTLEVGDVSDAEQLEKAMAGCKCVISLLASPQVTDEQDIYDVDYTYSHNVVEACRRAGIKQMIYCSDTGVYQPAICCQMHKLRIEGELLRCLPDGLQVIPFPALHFDHCSSWGAACAGIQPSGWLSLSLGLPRVALS